MNTVLIACSQSDYVAEVLRLYTAGDDNALEAYQACYVQEDEGDLDFVRRCAEQDYDDAPYGGAVYQEVYDRLSTLEPNV